MSKPIAMAYARQDGGKGIRNKVLIIFTTSCASLVAKRVAEHFRRLDQQVDYIGCEDCSGNAAFMDTFKIYVRHQNVGAALGLGQGCEKLDTREIERTAVAAGKPGATLFVNEAGGTEKAVEAGIRIVEELLDAIRDVKRVPITLGEMSFGAECGGSDFTSGLAANPLVGHFFDRVVREGGTALFEEIYEAIGLKDYLLGRCVDDVAKKQVGDIYDAIFKNAKEKGQFSISPGNMRGGLTSVEEKSMGAVAKSGTSPIQGAVPPGVKPPRHGLWVMGGPGPRIAHSGTGGDASSCFIFLSCGCHLAFLTSGRGHITGNSISPLVKVTGNDRTYHNLEEDVDVNASLLLTGEKTLDEMEEEVYQLVCRLANGEKSKSERVGHFEW